MESGAAFITLPAMNAFRADKLRMGMPETLTGLIERVTYHNPENGFAVLRVQVKGRQNL